MKRKKVFNGVQGDEKVTQWELSKLDSSDNNFDSTEMNVVISVIWVNERTIWTILQNAYDNVKSNR